MNKMEVTPGEVIDGYLIGEQLHVGGMAIIFRATHPDIPGPVLFKVPKILDGDDQLRLIKKLLKAQGLDETRWVPRDVQYFINQNKDEGMRPKALKDGNDPTRRQLVKLYQDYEDTCQRAGVVDFAELLLRAFELWRDRKSVV